MAIALYKSLLDCEKKRIIRMATSGQVRNELDDNVEATKHTLSDNQKVSQSNVEQDEVIMHDIGSDNKQKDNHIKRKGRKEAVERLTPLQKQCLESLVLTCTSDHNVNTAVEQPGKLHLEKAQNLEISGNVAVSPFLQQRLSKNSQSVFIQEENMIAQVFSILDALALKQVLLVMANYFPRTLEMLVMNKLSPLAAEVLTCKFDEMDSAFSESEQGEFYKTFYSVFEDSKLAMSALLDGKEAFSAVALKSVLEGYLGMAV